MKKYYEMETEITRLSNKQRGEGSGPGVQGSPSKIEKSGFLHCLNIFMYKIYFNKYLIRGGTIRFTPGVWISSPGRCIFGIIF